MPPPAAKDPRPSRGQPPPAAGPRRQAGRPGPFRRRRKIPGLTAPPRAAAAPAEQPPAPGNSGRPGMEQARGAADRAPRRGRMNRERAPRAAERPNGPPLRPPAAEFSPAAENPALSGRP